MSEAPKININQDIQNDIRKDNLKNEKVGEINSGNCSKGIFLTDLGNGLSNLSIEGENSPITIQESDYLNKSKEETRENLKKLISSLNISCEVPLSLNNVLSIEEASKREGFHNYQVPGNNIYEYKLDNGNIALIINGDKVGEGKNVHYYKMVGKIPAFRVLGDNGLWTLMHGKKVIGVGNEIKAYSKKDGENRFFVTLNGKTETYSLDTQLGESSVLGNKSGIDIIGYAKGNDYIISYKGEKVILPNSGTLTAVSPIKISGTKIYYSDRGGISVYADLSSLLTHFYPFNFYDENDASKLSSYKSKDGSYFYKDGIYNVIVFPSSATGEQNDIILYGDSVGSLKIVSSDVLDVSSLGVAIKQTINYYFNVNNSGNNNIKVNNANPSSSQPNVSNNTTNKAIPNSSTKNNNNNTNNNNKSSKVNSKTNVLPPTNDTSKQHSSVKENKDSSMNINNMPSSYKLIENVASGSDYTINRYKKGGNEVDVVFGPKGNIIIEGGVIFSSGHQDGKLIYTLSKGDTHYLYHGGIKIASGDNFWYEGYQDGKIIYDVLKGDTHYLYHGDIEIDSGNDFWYKGYEDGKIIYTVRKGDTHYLYHGEIEIDSLDSYIKYIGYRDGKIFYSLDGDNTLEYTSPKKPSNQPKASNSSEKSQAPDSNVIDEPDFSAYEVDTDPEADKWIINAAEEVSLRIYRLKTVSEAELLTNFSKDNKAYRYQLNGIKYEIFFEKVDGYIMYLISDIQNPDKGAKLYIGANKKLEGEKIHILSPNNDFSKMIYVLDGDLYEGGNKKIESVVITQTGTYNGDYVVGLSSISLDSADAKCDVLYKGHLYSLASYSCNLSIKDDTIYYDDRDNYSVSITFENLFKSGYNAISEKPNINNNSSLISNQSPNQAVVQQNSDNSKEKEFLYYSNNKELFEEIAEENFKQFLSQFSIDITSLYKDKNNSYLDSFIDFVISTMGEKQGDISIRTFSNYSEFIKSISEEIVSVETQSNRIPISQENKEKAIKEISAYITKTLKKGWDKGKQIDYFGDVINILEENNSSFSNVVGYIKSSL